MEFHCCKHFCAPLTHTHTSRSIQILWKQCQITSQPIVSVVFFFVHKTTTSNRSKHNKYADLQKCIIYMVMASQCVMKNACSKRQRTVQTKGSRRWSRLRLKWRIRETKKYVNFFMETVYKVSLCECERWIYAQFCAWVSECNAARNCSSKMWEENKTEETFDKNKTKLNFTWL